MNEVMQDGFAPAFARLARSKFRGRFHLDADDLAYIERVGLETIRRHCADFIRDRLAPANPPNDGKQTSMRGHPVFKAQHVCACCCRDYLAKWECARAVGVGLPDERSEELCVARSQEAAHVARNTEIPAERRNRRVSGAATHRDAAMPSGLSAAKKLRESRARQRRFPYGLDRAGICLNG